MVLVNVSPSLEVVERTKETPTFHWDWKTGPFDYLNAAIPRDLIVDERKEAGDVRFVASFHSLNLVVCDAQILINMSAEIPIVCIDWPHFVVPR